MTDRSSQREASALLLGGAVGQGALVIASPILTRIYTPTDIGVYTATAALGAIAANVAGGRYDQIIPSVPNPSEARTLYALASRLALVVAAVATCVAWIAFPSGTDVAQMLGVGALALAGARFQARNFYGMRLDALDRVGAARATQGVLTAAMQSALGATRLGAAGLLAGDISGRAIGARVAPVGARSPTPRAAELRSIARKHRRQLTVMAPAVLANMVSVQLPLLLAPSIIGDAPAGQFALAFRVVYAPTALIASALAAQYYTRASATSRRGEGRLPTLTREFAAFATQLALPLALGGVLLAPPLFPWVFGTNWADAGAVATPITVWAATTLVGSTVAGVMVLSGRQAIAFRLTLLDLLLTSFGVAVAGVAEVDVMTFSVLVSSASAIAAIASIVYFLRASGPGPLSAAGRRGITRSARLTILLILPTAGFVHLDDPWTRALAAVVSVAIGIRWMRHLLKSLKDLPR